MCSKDGESSFHHCGSPMKLVQVCLCAGNTLQRGFNRRRGTVKHVLACLSARKDRESRFQHCGGRASLFMCGKHPQRRFKHRGSAVKHLQSWLSARKDGESSFHYCGSPVKLVQAC